MSSGFPPIPVYPNDYDSDFTLFLVYNTSETLTVEDVDAWAEEIPIRPRHANQSELWADNGYATIAGELFYYDAVDKNDDDRVCVLKRCVRNLGGNETQFNEAGTWVRGFVVAEHHNQLTTATLLVENFVGENFSPEPATLDWRIRHLADSPIQSDDYCPEVQFDFNIVSSSPLTGTIARYAVTINGRGTVNLQFGDGSFTNRAGAGTHVYAPGANIDPVVIVSTDLCQIIQSPINRTNPDTPTPVAVTPPFFVPVPIPPPIPSIIIPSIVVPPPTVNIPPVVFPCVNPGGIPSVIIVTPPINIPSTIDITPINIPSKVTITPVNIPSKITGPDIQVPSHITSDIPPTITIEPPPPIPPIQIQPPQIPPIQIQPGTVTSDIPSVIQVQGANMPSTIRVDNSGKNAIPSVIKVVDSIPNKISVVGSVKIAGGGSVSLIADKLQVDSLPKLEFDTRSLQKMMMIVNEQMVEALKINLPDFSKMKFPDLKVDWGGMPTLKAILKLQKAGKRKKSNQGLGFAPDLELDHEELDFPGEFKLLAPDIPPMKVEHNIPKSISVQAPNFRDIRIDASNLPTEIRLAAPKEDIRISVVPFELPKLVFDTEPLEKIAIPVKLPDKMPDIRVVFPDVMPGIKVEFPKEIPTIKVEVPENTRIPLIYEGPPIPIEPVQINLKVQHLADSAANDIQCVAIVPCPRR